MNMEKMLIVALVFIISSLNTEPALSAVNDQNGSALFEEHCASCHGGNADPTKRMGPPVVAIRSHYLPDYKTKDQFIDAIVRWVKTPSQDYALMPGAIKRFKIMAAIDLEEAEIKDIAEFIYDANHDVPGWFKQHYREQHGKDPE